MKKVLLLAAFSLLTMVSCSDNDAEGDGTDGVFLTKTIETRSNGTSITSNFNYDGNKLTSIEMSDNNKVNFIYSNEKLTSIEYRMGTTLEQRNLYTYDSEGRLAQLVELIFGEDNDAERRTFTYNTDGTVSTKLYSGNHTEQATLEESGTITYSFGNLTQYTTGNTTYTYTFDSKNNPEKNIFAIDVLNLGWVEGGMNNITGYSSTTGGNYTTTYTYNPANYPVMSQEVGGGTTTTTQYFYE